MSAARTTFLVSTAKFSPCRSYRYTLTRAWKEPCDRWAMFVGLNPSTADEVDSDPTITRCVHYARRWGYGGLLMTNIFALRSTDPKVLYRHPEPVGEENDAWLKSCAAMAEIIIAGWGVHGALHGRGQAVRYILPQAKLHILKLTQARHPGHPLYLKADLRPMLWEGI